MCSFLSVTSSTLPFGRSAIQTAACLSAKRGAASICVHLCTQHSQGPFYNLRVPAPTSL